MLEFRIDRGLSRNQVRQDVSIHEREKNFEINSEDGPWVSKGQTGWLRVVVDGQAQGKENERRQIYQRPAPDSQRRS